MTAAVAPSVFTPPNPPPSESPHITNLLIVDGDRLVRDACREAATALGYTQARLESGEQALWLIGSQGIDIVLLDLNLTTQAGWTYARSSIDVQISRSLSSVRMPRSIWQSRRCNGAARQHVAKPSGLP